jgi:hypothetical protein
VLALAALLIAAGEGGLMFESHRLYTAQLQRQFQKDPTAAAAEQFLKQPLPADADAKLVRQQQQFREELARVERIRLEKLSFASFLNRRVAAAGSWPAPWPAVFWGGEVLLGAAGGAWLAAAAARRAFCPVCQDWHAEQRSLPLRPAEWPRVLELLEQPAPAVSPETQWTLACLGCRCDEAIPEVQMTLAEPRRPPRVFCRVRPSPEAWSQIRIL